MKETSKAARRRFIEDKLGGFQWHKIFRGKGLDVGSGDDPLPICDCRSFDKEDGDANDLTKYFEPESFDFVHSSQCLEHTLDPSAALRSWLAITKKRGYVIATVPDFVLYEGLRWPSQWNPDHKSSWSLSLLGSPAPIHCYLPIWLGQFAGTKILRCQIADSRYNYKLLGTTVDQTFPKDGAEAFIEFVLLKK